MPKRRGRGFNQDAQARVWRRARTRGLEEDHETVRLGEVVLEQVQAALREAILRLVHTRLVKPEVRLVQAEQSQPELFPDGADSCHHGQTECWDQQENEGRPDIVEKKHRAHDAHESPEDEASVKQCVHRHRACRLTSVRRPAVAHKGA